MTILRICVDNSIYSEKLSAEFEELLKPVFRFISEPSKISFEDDILLLIKSLIKKQKKVSPLMWEIFDFIP